MTIIHLLPVHRSTLHKHQYHRRHYHVVLHFHQYHHQDHRHTIRLLALNRYGCSGGPNDMLDFDTSAETVSVTLGGETLCFGVEADDPAGSTFSNSLQACVVQLFLT